MAAFKFYLKLTHKILKNNQVEDTFTNNQVEDTFTNNQVEDTWDGTFGLEPLIDRFISEDVNNNIEVGNYWINWRKTFYTGFQDIFIYTGFDSVVPNDIANWPLIYETSCMIIFPQIAIHAILTFGISESRPISQDNEGISIHEEILNPFFYESLYSKIYFKKPEEILDDDKTDVDSEVGGDQLETANEPSQSDWAWRIAGSLILIWWGVCFAVIK